VRILLVTNIFPPIIGGPATFIDGLAHELAHRGHEVSVVCSSEGPDPEDAGRPFRVIRCDIGNRYAYEVKVRAVLVRELARHRTVLVNGLETYVEPIARRLRRRYVLKVVGDPVWETARNLGRTALTFDDFQASTPTDAHTQGAVVTRNRYLSLASVVVTPSDYLTGVVSGWGVPRGHIVTVPNGVVTTEISYPAARTDGQPLDVVFVGRLTNWKGVETAVLAMRGLTSVRLTVIGGGPEAPLLREITRQLALSAVVTFAGQLTHEETNRRIRAAHALLLPSCYEGLSHTLLEAGDRGVPVVASDIGGNRALVSDGVNGLLVPYGDAGALAAALRTLRDDEHGRLRLGKALRRTVEDHSFAVTTNRYAALLMAGAVQG
jgi:glycosyltransferase involved in cell wall biosynthesis